jgi:uncharacterized damage-inducible protein DinB
MGFAKQTLQVDLDYSAWANRRLIEACSALTPEERTRDLGVSHHTVLLTLHHIYDSELFWSNCVQGTDHPYLPPDVPFEELQCAWPLVWSGLDQWLATVTDDDLAQVVGCQPAGAREIHATRWHVLRHSVNHATLHRGQVVGMVRALGKQPPNVDLITYYVKMQVATT